MAQITLTIPDEHMPFVIDTLCELGGWTDAEGPRPAFAKRVLVNWLKGHLQQRKHAQIMQQAEANATTVDWGVT